MSDTTALTTLIKAGQEHLLAELFGALVIPAAVASELLRFHSALPSFCEIRIVADTSRLARLRDLVDAGEAEAICLAVELSADALLIDDKKGRRVAENEGLTCLGLPAVLLAAKQQGIVGALEPLLQILADRGSYRLSTAARAVLLLEAGEA